MKFRLLILSVITLLISTHAIAGKKEKSIKNLNSPNRVPDRYIIIYNNTSVNVEKNNLKVQYPTKQAISNITQNIAQSTNSTIIHLFESGYYGSVLQNTDQLQIESLLSDPAINRIYVDEYIYVSAIQSNPLNWGLDRIDEEQLPVDHQYNYGNYNGTGVNAYIFDTGVYPNSDFENRLLDEYTFITAGNGGGGGCAGVNPYGEPGQCTGVDPKGHGTRVAGVIGGKEFGVAKNINITSYRTFNRDGRAYLSDVIAAINYLLKGSFITPGKKYTLPAVANMSFAFSPQSKFTFRPVIQEMIDAGISVITAAGNSGLADCDYPAKLNNIIPEVISVGATDESDRQASFSNYGTCIDLFAPGVEIKSAANNYTDPFLTDSGTSYSAPFVTGAAALYLQQNISASPLQVKNAIVTSSTQNAINFLGTGSPNLLLNTTNLLNLPVTVTPDQYDDIAIRGYTDDYEGDAESLLANIPQTHNFHDAGDEDWTMVWSSAIQTYHISTQKIGSDANTNLFVYKVTDIDVNPDFPGQNRFIIHSKQLVASDTNGGTSSINFTSEPNFLYVMKTISANNAFGSNTNYSILSQKINPDSYDDVSIRGYTDDYAGDAEPLLANISQTHNFHDSGDQDWTMIWSSAIQTYNVSTQSLGLNAGTKLYIYKVTDIELNPLYPGQNRFNIIAKQLVASDTNGGNSNINFTSEANFLYVIETISDNNSFGDGTQYVLKQIKLN